MTEPGTVCEFKRSAVVYQIIFEWWFGNGRVVAMSNGILQIFQRKTYIMKLLLFFFVIERIKDIKPFAFVRKIFKHHIARVVVSSEPCVFPPIINVLDLSENRKHTHKIKNFIFYQIKKLYNLFLLLFLFFFCRWKSFTLYVKKITKKSNWANIRWFTFSTEWCNKKKFKNTDHFYFNDEQPKVVRTVRV